MKSPEHIKAMMLLETMIAILLLFIAYAIVDLSFTTYYSAQFSERKVQCETLDRALEGYAKNHLAVLRVEEDEDGNSKTLFQKTYPASLDDLEKTGYINHFKDIELDNFKYTPHEEETYGNTRNYTYYELKVKIPNSASYYTSPGSERSKYLAENN